MNNPFHNLPLPWRERIEVRGNDSIPFFTLTLALSPQGRGKSRNEFFLGGGKGDFPCPFDPVFTSQT
jgi:hypothetical protein